MNDALDPSAYAALWAVVAVGSVVPVLPTGAAVSAAAVLAIHTEPWAAVLVVAIGAFAAYVGDLLTYAALRAAGEPLALRMRWLRRDDTGRLDRVREGIERHEIRTLSVARLVPAGRLPVLVAAAVSGYTWRRFASTAVVSTLTWAVLYAAIGVAGATFLPDTSTAVIVAVVGALLVTGAMSLIRRLRE